MKLVAEPIILPDNATWQDIEDAKLSAKWHEVKSLEYFMAKTNLDHKCGSCKFFTPCKSGLKAHGFCDDGIHEPYRARTTPACKNYERKIDGKNSSNKFD